MKSLSLFLFAGIFSLVVTAGSFGSRFLGAPSEALAQAVRESDEGKKIVPYVPTPQEVVERMLELAGVKKGDVLYDLGSGDGRIVITAAQKYGVRAIGIDIDPQRIKEATANASAAKVSDKVRFIEGDLFEAD